MSDDSTAHDLGRVDVATLADTPALSRDVALDIAAVQAAWPAFEGAFDSLQGRRMMGLAYGGTGIYRMSSARLERDADNPLDLDETVIPGGDYLRLRLRGAAPEVYGRIGDAFDALFARAGDDHDESRPHIEHYRREGEIDCLVPVRPLA
ncbi:AraC family transcriptional regulator [Serinibacter arcticus]|uniref:AraC family transcriptional regulator n=1 Tax=Serinibacter arcticus TaxID=1655435 RepID=A0A2U1ZVK7_9MICO|nr:GyrI-like domain-containing protein [Serinibacter arcticus]PWD51001.1 AraC family transcriptional regulator [Serinibacter arcticus]